VEQVFLSCLTEDIGVVVGGIVFSGNMTVENYDKKYYIGPHRGQFLPITIDSIHRQRLPIRCIKAGQTASCSIMFRTDTINQKEPPHGFRIRRGQVILSLLPEQVFWEIEAELTSRDQLLNQLNAGSQGVIFTGNVRQGAKLLSIQSSGRSRLARFKFVNEPEWLQPNRTLLFRQDKISYLGKVVNVF
jgi:GTPase